MALDPSLFLSDLEKMLGEIDKKQIPSRSFLAVPIFIDMADSSALKLKHGDKAGVEAALRHNAICRQVIDRYKGTVIKELGDGVLGFFSDPSAACLAALNVKNAVSRLKTFSTKVGMTIGDVEELILDGRADILGACVDRAARICSVARGNQIVLDKTLKDVVEPKLKQYSEIVFSKGREAELKGVGTVELFELSAKSMGFAAATKKIVICDEIEVSPVGTSQYPEFSDPKSYLICDVCGKSLPTNGEMCNILFHEDKATDTILKVFLVHKKESDAVKAKGGWKDLSDLANPEQYAKWVVSLLNCVAKGQRIADPRGIIRALLGMYRNVFRPSTEVEHLDLAEEIGLAGL